MEKSRGRVMIVDDELDLAKALAEILELEGFVTRYYGDPRKAIAASEEFAPQIIVSDIAMPEMTGPEMMTQWVVRHGITKTPPVIFMTGHLDAESPPIEGVVKVSHLIKPVVTDELIRLVSHYFET